MCMSLHVLSIYDVLVVLIMLCFSLFRVVCFDIVIV